MNSFPAIILAAGASTRMGRDKACLPWVSNQPLVSWTVATMENVGWGPIVVAGPHNFDDLVGLVGAKRVVLNPNPAAGKAGSILRGIGHLTKVIGPIMLASIDQPRPSRIYRELRAAAETDSEGIHIPDDNGHRGHPVVFGAHARHCLDEVSDADLGLRGLLDRHSTSLMRWPLPHAPWNLNEPDAYHSALAEAENW